MFVAPPQCPPCTHHSRKTLNSPHLVDTLVSEISTSVRKALARVLGDTWPALCEALTVSRDVIEKVKESRTPLMSFLALWEDGQFTQKRLPALQDLLDALRKAYGDQFVQDRMVDGE